MGQLPISSRTTLKAMDDVRVYLTGSAGAGAGSPAPAGPQILRSARLPSAPFRHPMTHCDSRKFQCTDPLVSPLNLQCSLLPIGFVPNISRQDHLALAWDIVDDNIENGLEIPSICFTESKHSASECLKRFERGVECDFEPDDQHIFFVP